MIFKVTRYLYFIIFFYSNNHFIIILFELKNNYFNLDFLWIFNIFDIIDYFTKCITFIIFNLDEDFIFMKYLLEIYLSDFINKINFLLILFNSFIIVFLHFINIICFMVYYIFVSGMILNAIFHNLLFTSRHSLYVYY